MKLFISILKKNCLYFKSIILLFFFLLIFKKKEKLKNKNKRQKSYDRMKICICTYGKKENRYIREFVQHYEKYDVDKIYLYDNNDIKGERFEDVIQDYIDKGFVKIINWRGVFKGLYKVLNECYQRNYKKYDWLILYELDEFIHLHNYTSIKSFLNEDRFKSCQLIYLNLVCHTDNNLLYYENKSLAERFPIITKYKPEVKSILRGHIQNIRINHIHQCTNKLINCNGFGHKNKIRNIFATEPDYKFYYIDHYYSKSTEEFIIKLKRGDMYKYSKNYIMHKIRKYYLQNNFTKEKIELIENRTGFNLSNYKNLLGIK